MYTLKFGDYEFPNKTFEVTSLPLNNRIQENPIPRRHGVIIQAPYLQSRTIKISGILHNDTAETTHTQLLAMQKALLAGEGKFYYRSDRYINCYAKKINPEFEAGTDKAVANVDIDLIAQNPFSYSDGASYSTAQDAVDGVTINFDIFSGGNVFAEPMISICATGQTINDDISVKNVTTGKEFKFRGILAPGLTLTVDTEKLEVKNNLVDALSNFEGDFITLDAGTNAFQVIGGTQHVLIEHKYRWYS